MRMMNKLALSSDLVNGMADRLGVDIPARLVRNPELEAIRLKAAIARCSHCTNQDDCVDLQGCTSRLEDTPDYCQNKNLFKQIRRL